MGLCLDSEFLECRDVISLFFFFNPFFPQPPARALKLENALETISPTPFHQGQTVQGLNVVVTQCGIGPMPGGNPSPVLCSSSASGWGGL